MTPIQRMETAEKRGYRLSFRIQGGPYLREHQATGFRSTKHWRRFRKHIGESIKIYDRHIAKTEASPA